jgi:hypothetical protein
LQERIEEPSLFVAPLWPSIVSFIPSPVCFSALDDEHPAAITLEKKPVFFGHIWNFRDLTRMLVVGVAMISQIRSMEVFACWDQGVKTKL